MKDDEPKQEGHRSDSSSIDPHSSDDEIPVPLSFEAKHKGNTSPRPNTDKEVSEKQESHRPDNSTIASAISSACAVDTDDELDELDHASRTRSRGMEEKIEQSGKDDPVPYLSAIWEAIWPILKPNYIRYDYNSFKVWSRTWLHCWIGVLFIVITPLRDFVGPTAYLMPLASFVEVSGGASVCHAIIGAVITAFYLMFSFLTLAVADAITWRVRGSHSKQEILAQLVAEGICRPGDYNCMTEQIITGRYITFATTAVNVFSTVCNLWILGYWEVKYPKIFKAPFMVSLIGRLSLAPLSNASPYFSFWDNVRPVAVPYGLSLAFRVVLSFIIYPTTSNSKFLKGVIGILNQTVKQADTFIDNLSSVHPSDPDFGAKFETHTEIYSRLMNSFGKLDVDAVMVRLECSYGRFDAGDLGEFRARLRTTLFGLDSFHFFVNGMQERKEALQGSNRQRTQSFHSKPYKGPLRSVWTSTTNMPNYKEAGTFESKQSRKLRTWNWDTSDPDHRITLKDLDLMYEKIIEHYMPVLRASNDVLRQVAKWMSDANKFRTYSLIIPHYYQKRLKQGSQQKAALAEAIQKLEAVFNELIKDPSQYRERIKRLANGDFRHQIYALGQDAFFSFQCKEYASRVHRLGRYCVKLDEVKPRPRWITPFTKSKSKALTVKMSNLDESSTRTDEISPFRPLSQVGRRDPDSSPPRTFLHMVGLCIYRVHHFWIQPTISFNTRRAFFVNVPMIIIYVRPTLEFAYGIHAIWAAILTAMTMSRQAVDGVYGLLTRAYFTFMGCLLGMVTWYISAGSGRGSPYGLAATTAVVFVGVVMHRHFSSHRVPMGSVVMCVAQILVPGASYLDSYSPRVGIKLGIGFHVAWIRFVTVLIGVTLGFLGSIFPNPTTGKKAIRQALGATTQQMGENLASIINFAMQRLDDPQVHIRRRGDLILSMFRQLSLKTFAAEGVIDFMKFEPPLGGVWPRKRYILLVKLLRELSLLESMSYRLLDHVDDVENIPEILNVMGLTDAEQLADAYAVLFMAGNSLVHRAALPSMTPGRLSQRYLAELRNVLRQKFANRPAFVREDTYLNHDGRLRLVAMMLASLFYERVDAVMILTKKLVGEAFDTDTRVLELRYDVI